MENMIFISAHVCYFQQSGKVPQAGGNEPSNIMNSPDRWIFGLG